LALLPKQDTQDAFTMAWCFLGWAFALFMGSALAVILIQRAAMQGLVLVDELIGFANCRQFDLMLERRCQKYHCRDNGGFALLYLDLDRFKAINDSFGHKAGDHFLVEVSRRISQAIRGGDLPARWGADEFAMIVDNSTEMNITHVMNRVRELTEQPAIWRDQQLKVGASIGIVQYSEDGQTPEALLGAADQSMYHNKRERHTDGASDREK
jgi:diguanylate cyclase (GGDEF)-like protein